ncbi:hypothetical protein Rhein_1934 [Rheinheimera sp. A13L]|uniref:polysaccharide lyase n=1 Tax=Rheinheimera sp. A13L TaxID=506534 RepID=UPI000212520E|nr:hypothetical protein [Rheinheimera sp. A13L]EGM77988.1 hypothetical protein Rhein_1934 [Rheinheimera sp. A13L]
MKIIFSLTTAFFLVGCGADEVAVEIDVETPENVEHPAVFVETFDGKLSQFGQTLSKKRYAALVEHQGELGSKAMKVTYQGFEQGSYRVYAAANLPQPALQYKMSFAVKFCDNFDFVLGGKLHGLGPENPVTGGDKITAEGWSARLMFGPGGTLRTYVYHQDMKGKFGDIRVAEDFRFIPGLYHQVEMLVSLNSAPQLADGKMVVSVDGAEIIYHDKLRFRAKDTKASLINKMIFITFHGGATPDWAPRTVDGSYKAECAYFDNFVVSKVI